MNTLVKSFVKISLAAIFFSSCAPSTVNPPFVNSLNTLKSKFGILSGTGSNSNTYSIGLQCTCPFPMKVESADSADVIYNLSDIGTTIVTHTVTATARPGRPKGMYIDSVIMVTIPPTVETFRDTLRDTVVVP
jgi:hypothetical protein